VDLLLDVNIVIDVCAGRMPHATSAAAALIQRTQRKERQDGKNVFLASWREVGLKGIDLAEPQRTQRKIKTQ